MAAPVVHVAGARPNFPKLAPVIRAMDHLGVRQELVHTGQHYDDAMSEVFFRQLDLPKPDVNLGVGSGTHVAQTAAIMTGLETRFISERPSLVVVYGDVNSTVAAALVASKLGIPVAHVEAGLRSFDRTMPEELNRIVTDQLSDVLLATSADAVGHLAREGVAIDKIHLAGNPMIDSLMRALPQAGPELVRQDISLPGKYVAATLHRPGNVDQAGALARLVPSLHQVADLVPIVLPVHPRGRQRMQELGLFDHPRIQAVEPLGYLEFVSLMQGAELVVTDSGGVQEETTILGVPCFTLRPNTERPVTISHGTNRLSTADGLVDDVRAQLAMGRPQVWPVPPLWDGSAGQRIAAVLADFV